MNDIAPESRISAVRRFNRFYTKHVGALNEGLLASPLSLTEARILYELAHRDGLTAAMLARDLALDPAYLSRILKSFRSRGFIESRAGTRDRRERILQLTPAGRDVFDPLEQASRDEVATVLAGLSEPRQRALVAAMRTVETILGADGAAGEPGSEAIVIRPHRPGDIGWIVHRHGALYSREYGWDDTFEGMVAEIAGQFLKHFTPKRERCWIAERDGEIVGSVFLVQSEDTGIAKLRLLYVEPAARGCGIGRRLVEECIGFARQTGYKRITLWTNDILVSARRIYEAAGFRLVSEEKHHSFGHDLVGQYWRLDLE